MTDEERIAAVQEYLDGKGNIAEIARRHRISSTVFKDNLIMIGTVDFSSDYYLREMFNGFCEAYNNAKEKITKPVIILSLMRKIQKYGFVGVMIYEKDYSINIGNNYYFM